MEIPSEAMVSLKRRYKTLRFLYLKTIVNRRLTTRRYVAS